MAPLSSNRIAWTYTADDGNQYRVAAEKALTDQGVLGGSAAAGTVPPRPAVGKMRRMSISAAGVGSRTVPIYSLDATLATNPATTITANLHGDSHTFTRSNGRIIPELNRGSSVTKQST